MEDRVLVRFSDDEILEGRARGIDIDRPAFQLVVDEPGSNSRSALVPLTSVKRVSLTRAPLTPTGRTLQKVALRFRDGEVLKGLLVDGPHPGVYGVVVELADPAERESERLIIAYDNLKAVFYLSSWDSRPAEFVNVTGQWAGRRADTPLVDLLGEIRRLGRLRDRGYISAEEYERRRRAVLERI